MKPKRLATNKQKAVLYILQEGLCNICKQELIDYEADHIKEWSTAVSYTHLTLPTKRIV